MTRTELLLAVTKAKEKTTDPQVLDVLNVMHRKIEQVYGMLFVLEEKSRQADAGSFVGEALRLSGETLRLALEL
jgi:hypothetical protein